MKAGDSPTSRRIGVALKTGDSDCYKSKFSEYPGPARVVSSPFVANRQVSKRLRFAVERTREFVNEGPNESRCSGLNHHLCIRVNRLAVLVLVGRRDKYGITLFEIILRDV